MDVLDDFGKVEEDDPAKAGVGQEQRTHEMPIPPSDITAGADAGEVVAAQCLQNQRGLDCRIAGHGLLEALGVVLVLPRVIESHATKLTDECILLAALHHGRQMLPHRVVLRAFLKAAPWALEMGGW